jgi:hypothetical protein
MSVGNKLFICYYGVKDQDLLSKGPCITNEQNRQLWWHANTEEPHLRNSGLRKEHYNVIASVFCPVNHKM